MINRKCRKYESATVTQKQIPIEHFDFSSPQNLNARKAELLVGLSSLKSVGAQVAKKFEEIKGSISVAGVAGVTPVRNTSSGLYVKLFSFNSFAIFIFQMIDYFD